jgi:hypothetical protein
MFESILVVVLVKPRKIDATLPFFEIALVLVRSITLPASS